MGPANLSPARDPLGCPTLGPPLSPLPCYRAGGGVGVAHAQASASAIGMTGARPRASNKTVPGTSVPVATAPDRPGTPGQHREWGACRGGSSLCAVRHSPRPRCSSTRSLVTSPLGARTSETCGCSEVSPRPPAARDLGDPHGRAAHCCVPSHPPNRPVESRGREEVAESWRPSARRGQGAGDRQVSSSGAHLSLPVFMRRHRLFL